MTEYSSHPTFFLGFIMCVPARVYVHHTHAGAPGGQWTGSFAPGITGSCELPNVGAGTKSGSSARTVKALRAISPVHQFGFKHKTSCF